MRITIAPSEDQTHEQHKLFAVTVEHPNDDATMAVVLEIMVKALQGYGFTTEEILKGMEEVHLP
jgi:hypothetical protein